MIKYKPNLFIRAAIPLITLIMAACADNMSPDEDCLSGKDSNEVYITVSLPNHELSTRAGVGFNDYFSRGAKINTLFFEIYEEKSEGGGTIYEPVSEVYNRPFSNTDTGKIKLSLDQTKNYMVAMWAQCTKTNSDGSFNTYPYEFPKEAPFGVLSHIKVHYSYEDASGNIINDPNNDESRDAFAGVCRIVNGVAENGGEAVLYRPFAQINIGTSGADYATLIYDPMLQPSNVTITESKITIKGVANIYNVLSGEAIVAFDDETGETLSTHVDEETGEEIRQLVCEFDWARLPAWIQLQTNNGFNGFPGEVKEYEKVSNPFLRYTPTERMPAEQFLRVELNNDRIFEPYTTEYPTISYGQDVWGAPDPANIIYKTELFKYLSMCYVLVPSSSVNPDAPTMTPGAIVTVNYDLRQKKGPDDENPIQLLDKEILNVPVLANSRTNILGGLHFNANPDPTSIFNYYQLPVVLVDDFDGDYNERFYTASLNVVRDEIIINDGLQITCENGEIPVRDNIGEFSRISQNINFSGESTTVVLSVKDGYSYQLSYTVDRTTVKNGKTTTNWEDSYSVSDDRTRTILTLKLYPGATTGIFTVRIIPPKEVQQ